MNDTVVLFRPIGCQELELIEKSGFTQFPPQAFSPAYLLSSSEPRVRRKVARDWNTKDADSGYMGYVTRFRVRRDYLSKYPVQLVGARSVHEEYWIPAEDLEQFNENLVGLIEIIASFQADREDPLSS
jgi:hypothetical protein